MLRKIINIQIFRKKFKNIEKRFDYGELQERVYRVYG